MNDDVLHKAGQVHVWKVNLPTPRTSPTTVVERLLEKATLKKSQNQIETYQPISLSGLRQMESVNDTTSLRITPELRDILCKPSGTIPENAFRFFRILMTGPNSSDHFHLALGGFELYGTIFTLPQQGLYAQRIVSNPNNAFFSLSSPPNTDQLDTTGMKVGKHEDLPRDLEEKTNNHDNLGGSDVPSEIDKNPMKDNESLVIVDTLKFPSQRAIVAQQRYAEEKQSELLQY